MTGKELIPLLGLQPHPEGGWYRELHRSSHVVVRADGKQRSSLTAILFLLLHAETSRWHRVCDADGTWHFAAGDPLELFTLSPFGGAVASQVLGSPEQGHVPLAVVAADTWQAARCPGRWSLVSCCVGPGVDFADFKLMRDLPVEQRPTEAWPDLL